MKANFIHVCFIIDESGSMSGSEADVVGGFNRTIQEQRDVKDGQCAVSLFSFNSKVTERFIGKDVNDIKHLTVGSMFNNLYSYSSATSITAISINGEVETFNMNIDEKEIDPLYQYTPFGSTAMNDGIGTAIDRIGQWLNDMPEEERPSKNLIVIMTDGEENSSKEYSLKQVQDMIKHQTDKYNWTFAYMGMDISNAKTADNLGIHTRSFSSKASTHMFKNYSNIGDSISAYRCADDSLTAGVTMDTCLTESFNAMTTEYEQSINKKI